MSMSKLVYERRGVRVSPPLLRKQLKEHAQRLLETSEDIWHGHSLNQLLAHHNICAKNFVKELDSEKRRWGNTIDIAVCAHLMELPLRLSDLQSG
eukprot:5675491-Amphidinium_carterae.1